MTRTPTTRRSAIKVLRVVTLSTLLVLAFGATAPSQTSGPRRWSGSHAVQRAGARLPAIAARHRTTPAVLERRLLQDPTLWIDSTDQLFYIEAAASDAQSDAPSPAGFDPGPSTFLLHSQPGAQRVIYLDFDGENISGTSWNDDFATGGDCYADPYDTDGAPGSFGQAERETIYGVWQRVAEDYAPFAIDVTTEDPGAAAIDRAGAGDLVYGTRAVITTNTSLCPNAKTLFENACESACGGVAYLGVFDHATMHAYYQPALIFHGGVHTEKGIAEATSHEVGHNLGLSHDGTSTEAYYKGHGPWCPIMGSCYTKAITQFSLGEYADANNFEDDFLVMQSNGADPVADDHGDTRPTATPLAGPTLSGAGTISTRFDVDVFEITVTGGLSLFTASPAPTSPNLDIRLELRDSSDVLIAASDPGAKQSSPDSATGLDATIIQTLAAGTYYLWVDGVGVGTASTGYTDYGSLGNYTIDGTLDIPSICGAAPVPPGMCRLITTPQKGGIQLKNSADPAKDQIKWKWKSGAATGLADFKDPVNGSATMQVCLYDGSGSSQPLLAAHAFPGGTCGTKPCWKATGTTGYAMTNKAGMPQGLTKMKLKAGIAGKAQIQVQGGGLNLAMPALPLTMPVVVQLLIDDGMTTECWQTTFTTAVKNDPLQFNAKGP